MNNAGRPLSAIDTANNIHYAEAAAYTAFGAPTSINFGAVAGGFAGYQLHTPLNTFNKRLQPTLLEYQVPGTGTILSRFYTYGPALQNNGNISAITDNLVSDRSAVYTYDQLNRIASAQSPNTDCSAVTTNPALTKNWGNTYTIDAWGNLTAKPVTKCSSESLPTSVNLKNQLGVGTHDAAGNLMNNGSASYTYDAENRIVSTAGATYVYDGDGVRVKKSDGAAAPTLYWGESFTDGPVTETDLSGTIKAEYVYFGGKRIARRDFPGGSVHYHFSDHLKSVNLVYNASGTREEDSDFYPYGGERAYVIGAGNHFKFTGKERDPESGLDYFGARYYGNSLGRFLTPDWADKATAVPYAEFGDPQSLNLYGYVRNHPITKTDGDGHEGTGFLESIEQYLGKLGQSVSDCLFGDSGRGTSGGNVDNLVGPRAVQENTKALAEGVDGAESLVAPLDVTNVGAASKAMMQHDSAGVLKAMAPMLIPIGKLETHTHHLLPKAFKPQFAAAGLNIEKYTVKILKADHTLNPNGIHMKLGGNWNAAWKQFFKQNPNATAKEILKQLDSMMKEFNITKLVDKVPSSK